MPPFQLSSTRSCQKKGKPSVLNQPMHFIQQGRNFLDFINDNWFSILRRLKTFAKKVGT